MTNIEQIRCELDACVDPIKKEYLPRFFKTGVGQYGEGDRFLGVVVPQTRLIAKRHKELSASELKELLQSEWHECRLCALLIMVERFKKSKEIEQKRLFDLYLSQTSRINNWDLVDLSCPVIVGGHLLNRSRTPLYQLAASSLLWDQRIAVVSTYTFIRNGEFLDTITLAERLLHHPHDLIQKAVGWMLREVGKRDKDLLVQFLEQYCKEMPRTTLRYSIEKFSDEERQFFMKR